METIDGVRAPISAPRDVPPLAPQPDVLGPDGLPRVSLPELIQLCAVDSELFSRVFFSKTMRTSSPAFAEEMWNDLENPAHRFVNHVVFRGAGKTTRLRLFTAKRIAYNVSRTILYVGASEAHAVRSVNWLRNAVERNKLFSQAFGLRPGNKWQEHEIEIIHGVDEAPIWVLGVGITGNIRGINFDDYRPDLIVLDDILTDENTATLEQREKITNLVLGALKESLSREEVNAKMVSLTTPHHVEDVAAQSLKDHQFRSRVYGCWTPETRDLPMELQRSVWEDMFPTESLRADKAAALARNRLSVFLREMECRLTSQESACFRPEWLRYYDAPPQDTYCVVAIDPVPPPSARETAKGLRGKDFEAISVWGRKGKDFYLLDRAQSRGHDPSWTTAKTIEFALRWRAVAVIMEAVGYQRVLKGTLEAEMTRRKVFFPVIPIVDSRAKIARIEGAFSGIGPFGHTWVSRAHTDFIEQYTCYGPGYSDHDDLLDSSAIAVNWIQRPHLEAATEDRLLDDDDVAAFPAQGACP